MVLLAIILFVATATAQESEHMKFMGVPITGNINDFAAKFKSKGFSVKLDENGFTTLHGKFTNRETVIVLTPIDGTNNINLVCAFFEPNTSWTSLESHQNYLVRQFTKKYGEPTSTVRKIDSPYKDSGNFIFLGFHNEEVEYSDTWIMDNGAIHISICSRSHDSANIMILYQDNANAQILEDNIIDEI